VRRSRRYTCRARGRKQYSKQQHHPNLRQQWVLQCPLHVMSFTLRPGNQHHKALSVQHMTYWYRRTPFVTCISPKRCYAVCALAGCPPHQQCGPTATNHSRQDKACTACHASNCLMREDQRSPPTFLLTACTAGPKVGLFISSAWWWVRTRRPHGSGRVATGDIGSQEGPD